jgi:hypothetical protein
LDEHKDQYELVERYPASELWGQAGLVLAQPDAGRSRHFSFILKYGREKTFHGHQSSGPHFWLKAPLFVLLGIDLFG